MNKRLLFIGGLLTSSLALFKIAMPYLFQWKEAMGASEPHMWATVYSENLGISLLLLFFAYMSVFQADELLQTRLGRSLALAIGSLWVFRTTAELLLFKVGEDGAWWRVILFLALALGYLIPFATAACSSLSLQGPRVAPGRDR